MKLQGTTITGNIFGAFPVFGGGYKFAVDLPLRDGMPLEVEGTNGNHILRNGYVNVFAWTMHLTLQGSLPQVGQPIPIKSIKFVNNTVPTGSVTIPASLFVNGIASVDVLGAVEYFTQSTIVDPTTPELQYWTGLGGDDIDIEIEFDNDVIGVTAPNTGSIMTRMVG